MPRAVEPRKNMNEAKIKACPICGQPPTVTIGRRAGNGEWVALPMVRCKPCDYQKHGNSDDEAAAKWNERAGVRESAMFKTAETQHVGIKDLLGAAERGKDVYEGTWLEVECRNKKANPESNWTFHSKYPLPLADEAFAGLKDFREDLNARVVEVFVRRTPLTMPEPAAPNAATSHAATTQKE